jgi:uncharacterized repeat protein (TIGR02543 family)
VPAGTDRCAVVDWGTPQPVREFTDDTETVLQDVILEGAFPTEVSQVVSGLQIDAFYCVRASTKWATNSQSAVGEPVAFRVGNIASQTIQDFSAPALTTVGGSATLTANPTSNLTPVFSSNTPDVCEVVGDQVTIVGGGICSLSADQPGNTEFYAAPTVTVTFTIVTFSITYDLNGGSGVAPVDAGSPYGRGATVTVVSTTPSKPSNSFVEWNTQQSGEGGVAYTGGDTFALEANTVLYAQWTPAVTRVLSYDANDGRNAPDSTEHPEDSTVDLASTAPTRTGFRFDGWSKNQDGTGPRYGASAAFPLARENVVLYAQWIARAPLTYNPNGADGGTTPTNTEHDVDADNDVSLTAGNPGNLARSGFSFDGWTTAQNTGNRVSSVRVTGATTVYARWIANVTYDIDGGSSRLLPFDSSDYQPGDEVTVLPDSDSPSRTGFTFAGWNTGRNGAGTRLSPGSTFTMQGNQTLYAEWVSSMSYNANLADSGAAPTDSTVYRPGGSVTVRPNSGNLRRDGYLFDGWNTLANGMGTTIQPGAILASPGNTTLFAQWLPEVTITFNGNGNTQGTVPSPITRGLGQSVTSPPNSGSLARSGFTFRGWSLLPNGGSTIIPGVGSITPTGNMTVYAQWEANAPVSQGNGGGGGGGNGGSGGPATSTQPPRANPPALPPRIIPPVTRNPAIPLIPPTVVPTPPATTSPTPLAPGIPALPGLRNLSVPSTPGQNTDSNPPSGSSGSRGSSPFGSQITVDLGVPTTPQGAGAPSAPPTSQSVGSRTVSELAQESLQGFAPGASTLIEILGARTAARFVVPEANRLDQFTLIRAIESSVPTQAADFFAIDSVQPIAAPLPTPAWNRTQREGITEFFAGAGLGEPSNLSDLNLDDYDTWLLVSASSSTYAPGTEVYLTLTSQPLVLASAVVADDGTAQLSGTLPVEFLSAGEHRVRLVGIRALDGASVDDEGSVRLSDDLLSEIERFDLGTQATIAIMGDNPNGASHVALRVIPLIPTAPWWTLWFIAVGLAIALVLRMARLSRPVSRRVISAILVIGSSVPAVVLGWLSTVTAVVWWAVGLGLIGAVVAAIGPYRQSKPQASRQHMNVD